jgi:hypothetical protein
MNESVVERYREMIEALSREREGALPLLRDLYHEQVQFTDPMQSLVGIELFVEANRRLLKRAKSISVNLGAVTEQDGHLFAVWTMTFEPPVGPVLTVEGVTHATVRDGLIVYQRDYWDLLSSAAAALPGLGMIYRRLVGLFA